MRATRRGPGWWVSGAMAAVMVLGGAAWAQVAPQPGFGLEPLHEEEAPLDVPFVPTPDVVVDAMLELAGVGPEDVVYDLGSGDGRIPIAAARRYGARAVGIDLNPERVREARQNARAAGLGEEEVEFRQGDLFEADFSDATVVTLYLLPSVNEELEPRLLNELRPGTRVVSHAFDMGEDWKPARTQEVDGRTVYLWVVPDRACGETTVR